MSGKSPAKRFGLDYARRRQLVCTINSSDVTTTADDGIGQRSIETATQMVKKLLAADGSTYTNRMLSYWEAHDQWLDPNHQYAVFHGIAKMPFWAAAFADRGAIHNYYWDDAELVFRTIRRFMKRQGIEATFVHKIGNPAEKIAKRVEKGKRVLVVMGSHSHGAQRNLVLGSAVTKLLALCSTPVLLVH